MKKEDLIAGVGEIDEKIVDETGKKRTAAGGRRKMKVLFSVIAAVLVLSIIGSVVLVMNVTRPAAEKDGVRDTLPAETKTSSPTGAADDSKSGMADAEDKENGLAFYSKDEKDGYGDGDAPAEGELAAEGYGEPADGEIAGVAKTSDEPGTPRDPGELPEVPINGADAFILTAAEWRDLDNWPFFMNLVNSEKIEFPAFGVDPRCRVRVSVTGEDGSPLNGEKVDLLASDGSVLFSAVSGKDGAAYLFWGEGETPASVVSGEAKADVTLRGDTSGEQGSALSVAAEDVTLVKTSEAAAKTALQVSFIIDTTGSMGDELAYLQKDFASIAEDAGTDGVTYSVNFYRDEGDDYVTKCNPFSGDIAAVKSLLCDEYCAGGGDTPEAVDKILKAAITDNTDWADDCEKIAFLIFDAPPHDGVEETVVEAVRSAASRGIRLIPVVASNSDRETELFGRAIAAVTGGTYVFLTDDSGVGGDHLEPIIGDFKVELLHDVIVRIINEYKVG